MTAPRNAAALEGKRRAQAARLARYRYLTRELGWETYRARDEIGLSKSTGQRYERTLRGQVNA